MNRPQSLLNRLDAIGRSLAGRESALALIGLGSVGLERDRLDSFSDLDFFVIVQPGTKAGYLQDLSWLTDIAPVAYYFQNTKDGYKLLYEDGIFCEFAVFEEAELAPIPFAPGRIIWKAPGVDERLTVPQHAHERAQEAPAEAWLLGEALTNLYVGLQREQRGETLSAMRFIQGHAVQHVLNLAERLQTPAAVSEDPFSRERRFELRYPALVPLLSGLLQGYEKNRESAWAALAFLDDNFKINPAMKRAILHLCQHDD